MDAAGDSGNQHDPHLNLMPVDAQGSATTATHVAVVDGDWFDPATWAGGEVPGTGALVHIPEGVSVVYEGSSPAELFMVRVDGGLTFTADQGVATKMIVDTMITSPSSTLVVDARGPEVGTVDIEFAEGTPSAFAETYTDHSQGDGVIGRYDWDPDQLSLGLVASGKVDIKGQAVEARTQLSTGPVAGATEIVLVADLAETGWAPGQQIVIGGVTFAERDSENRITTEDEVRTITDVRMEDGKMVVTIDEPLIYDHSGPTDPTTGEELTGFVGNLSRNVTFSSAVADQDGDGLVDRGVSVGEAAGPDEHYVSERGHIMFMHNDDVTVHDISVKGLGRTDKSIDVDEVQTGGVHDSPLIANGGDRNAFEEGLDVVLETPADEMINPRARYPLHMHMANARGDAGGHEDGAGDQPIGNGVLGPCAETGAPICNCGDQDGDGVADCNETDTFDGVWIEGVSVWGSPGWGIVQHDTDAVLKDNVVFDVAGSAFVAETGNETGRWEGNLAIGTYGAKNLSDNTDSEQFNGDGGGSGNGFYLKARAIEVTDNAAQSSARAGFMWHTEGGDVKDPKASKLGEFGVTANHTETIRAERVAIEGFEGNVVIAARQGVRILASPEDSVRKQNDVYSHMKDFIGWEIDEAGVSVTYSSKYIFENFLLLGTDTKITSNAQQSNSGFYFKASVADITVLDSHVEAFTNAVTNWTQVGNRQEIRRGFWDPKLPASNPWVEIYEGLGEVEGIDNAAYNLWNTNVIGLTYDNLVGGPIRVPGINMEKADGSIERERGYVSWDSVEDVPNPAGVEIELLGDSRAGGLVALWREDIANDPNQRAMLDAHIPLAYQNKVYLGQITRDDGTTLARYNYGDYVEGISDDIWSGTVLEFAKSDSLGRQVFSYGDFSPLDPGAATRAVTTNERLVFSKEEIDATLIAEGYFTVRGIEDVKFVIMHEQFSDRLTGETKTLEILVALDLAWELPAGTQDGGFLMIHDEMIIAPQYRAFEDGVLVPGRDPITLGPPESTDIVEDGVSGLELSAPPDGGFDVGWGADVLAAGPGAGPEDVGSGDTLFGGNAFEQLGSDASAEDPALIPTEGNDVLFGTDGADIISDDGSANLIFGGGGDDLVFGDAGNDDLHGDDQDDRLFGQSGQDRLFGGNGADDLAGNDNDDRLFGGDGADRLSGGKGNDELTGGQGADAFVFEPAMGNDVITDFEDGVDAIEFLIGAFGFEDIEILRDGADTVIDHDHGRIRLLDTDSSAITVEDFNFTGGG